MRTKKSIKIIMIILFVLLFMSTASISTAKGFNIGVIGGLDVFVISIDDGSIHIINVEGFDIGLSFYGNIDEKSQVGIGFNFSMTSLLLGTIHAGFVYNFTKAPANFGIYCRFDINFIPIVFVEDGETLVSPGVQIMLRFTYLFYIGKTSAFEIGLEAGGRMFIIYAIVPGVGVGITIPIRAYIGFRF